MTKRASTMRIGLPDVQHFGKRLGALFSPLATDLPKVALETEGPFISGRSEMSSLRPGLRLITIDMDIRSDVELDVVTTCPGMFIALALDGRCRSEVRRRSGRDDSWEFLPGRNVVGTFEPDNTPWKICGGGIHRFVELQMAADTASQLIAEFREAAPGPLHPVITRLGDPPEFIPQALTPEMTIVAHQVLNCRLEGTARRLFMESKALEILALQMSTLTSPGSRQIVRPSKAERDRLEEARRILEQEYDDPPSLVALARRVGLNDFKLKRGFRAIFATTVYGYVRKVRMERAWSMLETGTLNVGEVATATGYTCFGHFSTAFRKQFGMAPREVKRARAVR